MFLVLLVCQFALAAANPFHKYPYVFLLDVGNEELEKTNTEQIRVSVPGGSLALRYPAIGDGDTISHVRVSGIDFGTDLKANIIDGGPGYKYVVLVFMGNTGVAYDAVITVQTVSDIDINQDGEANFISNSNNSIDEANDSSEVIDDKTNETTNDGIVDKEDANDSAEDTSDDTEKNLSDANQNAEVRQESSNIYNYVKNTADYESKDSNDVQSQDDDDDEKDIHTQYSVNNQESAVKDYNEDSETNDIDVQDPSEYQSKQEQDFKASDETGKSAEVEDDVAFELYPILRPNFYDGVRIYPQNRVPFVFRENSNIAYNPDETAEFDQMFNDEDDHSPSEKLRDSNNNFDSDDNAAVAI